MQNLGNLRGRHDGVIRPGKKVERLTILLV